MRDLGDVDLTLTPALRRADERGVPLLVPLADRVVERYGGAATEAGTSRSC